MVRERTKILENYRENLFRFGKIYLVAILLTLVWNLILVDNPFELTQLPFLALAILFICTLFYTILKLSYNRNYLLYFSSLMMIIYALTLDSQIMSFALMFFLCSFFYELGMKYYLGIRFEIKIREYGWARV